MANQERLLLPKVLELPAYSMLNPRLFYAFKLGAIVISLFVILVGLLGTIGWYSKISFLFEIKKEWPELKINAAISLILSGLSLNLIIYNKLSFARICTLLSLLIALSTTLEYLLNIDFGIDQLLVHDWTEDNTHLPPGRMGLASSSSFLFLDLALFVFSLRKKAEFIIILLTFPILMISSISFVTLLGGGELYLLFSHPMAMPTAICLFSIVVAIYFSGPLTGQFFVITNKHSSGFVARLLLPSSFIVPPVIVFISAWGKNKTFYDLQFQQAVIMMLSMGVCFLFSWVIIHILHQMDAREEKINDLLRASNKELEAFSYSISHDLQAPLRSISSFSDFLYQESHDKLDEKSKDYLNRIINASKRMGVLIEGILLLSRISRKQMTKESVNLSDIATTITDELKQAQPDRHIQLNIEPSVFANGDKSLLMVALQNLLNNAWKFTRNTEKPRIDFGVVQKNNQDTYFVSDNGVGFDPKYSDRLFTPFFRLHSAQEFEGTGIGLATVQRIIIRHGGKIWAQSEINKGCTFYFSL